MPPVAQTKTNELVSQLNQMAKQPDIDQLQLHRVKAEAKSLLQADAAEAHMVLGMAASLELDYEAIQSHFDAATKLRPGDTYLLANLCMTLSRTGFIDRARDTISEAYRLKPSDPELLALLIKRTLISGNFHDAFELIPKWNALCPDREYESINQIKKLISFIDRFEISDSIVNWIQRETSKLARDGREYRINKLSYTIMHDEESEWLACECELAAPVDYIVGINKKLAGVLAGPDLPDHIAPLLTSLYIPWEPDVDHAA